MLELFGLREAIRARHVGLPHVAARHVALFASGLDYVEIGVYEGITAGSARASVNRAGHSIFDSLGIPFTGPLVATWGTLHEACCLAAALQELQTRTTFDRRDPPRRRAAGQTTPAAGPSTPPRPGQRGSRPPSPPPSPGRER